MKLLGTITLVAVGVFVSCAQLPPRGTSLSQACDNLLVALGDQRISVGERSMAWWMLSHGNKNLFPVLIEHLDDRRVHDPAALLDDGSSADDSTTQVVTVGMACEHLLYHIILRGEGWRGFRVADWPAWWAAHKDKSMEDICGEARAENEKRSKNDSPEKSPASY